MINNIKSNLIYFSMLKYNGCFYINPAFILRTSKPLKRSHVVHGVVNTRKNKDITPLLFLLKFCDST